MPLASATTLPAMRGMIKKSIAATISRMNSIASSWHTARFSEQIFQRLKTRVSRKRMGMLAIKANAMPMNTGLSTEKNIPTTDETSCRFSKIS